MAEKISFKAKIEYVVYFKDTFGVVAVSTTQDIPFSKMKEDYDMDTNTITVKYTTTITGKMQEPKIGQTWDVIAHHVYNPKYKDQYQIDSINFAIPTTVADTRGYLESILTQNQADTLLETYPNIVQDVIDGKENVDLNLLKGFGEKTWEKTKDKIIENFAIADILAILIPLGISFKKIQKLLEFEGGNTQSLKETLVKNPYVLSKIDGISFKVVDKIATQMNPSLKESEERLVAFLDYYFEKLGNDKGNTWTSKENIKSEVINEVPEVEKFLDALIEKEIEKPKLLFIQEEKIGLKRFHDDEMFIWDKAHELSKTEPLPVTQQNIDDGIRIAEEFQGFQFTEEQKEVIINMTKNNFSLEVGKSGTGKTTTARGLLNIYKCAGYSVRVAAFSAKAAKRATEATGFEGGTLHRLLGIGQFRGKSSEEEDGEDNIPDVLFTDENSMNPLFLMKEIFKLVTPDRKIKIILCGDNKQIVPLGVGNVFSDLLEKDCFNKNVLTKIQRQAAKSGMILDGNLIRDGIDPIDVKETRIVHGENKDLIYLFRSVKDDIFRIAVSSYMKSVKEKGVGNTVLLAPFKTKGLNCTHNFNKTIQQELNSENKDIKFVHGDMEFWMGDFVINIKNNYEKDIMNGSLGFVVGVEASKIFVDFEGQKVEYTHEDINELSLAHCLTPHKFQGSQSLDAIVVMDSTHYVLLNSSWLYTAMTRPRERCLIITDGFAYNRCMKEDATIRDTWLKLKEFKNDEA